MAIRRALLPTGEVADDASPRLAELRRALVRLKAQLTSVMEGYLRSPDSERLLQDRIVTTRNDRYVLLLKAEQKGQLPGIVHGTSGSGASLFVEPLPAVELNNDIVELQDEERREVVRILQELTAQVGDRADEIAGAWPGSSASSTRCRRWRCWRWRWTPTRPRSSKDRRPSSSSPTRATRC